MRVLYAAALMSALIAAPAAAQSHYGAYGQGHEGVRRHSSAGGYDYQGQRDVPGDYRCDAYWDRGRTDCDAGWRDQRRHASRSAWGYGRHERDRHYRSGHHTGGHGYGSGEAAAYYGAYGRPDLIYPGGGHSQAGHIQAGHVQAGYGRRDPGRIDWCRASYRSYDVSSGYYRTYDGRLVFCG